MTWVSARTDDAVRETGGNRPGSSAAPSIAANVACGTAFANAAPRATGTAGRRSSADTSVRARRSYSDFVLIECGDGRMEVAQRGGDAGNGYAVASRTSVSWFASSKKCCAILSTGCGTSDWSIASRGSAQLAKRSLSRAEAMRCCGEHDAVDEAAGCWIGAVRHDHAGPIERPARRTFGFPRVPHE